MSNTYTTNNAPGIVTTVNAFGKSRLSVEPDNPRQNMEPSDMEPDDARKFIKDLMRAMYSRMSSFPAKKFEPSEQRVGNDERARQYYGSETHQLLSGIEAALRNWDESGEDVKELKERYGGTFVEGVEIGERLAVYEGRDFTFSKGEDNDEPNFTFIQ